jgi:hypothetical protein
MVRAGSLSGDRWTYKELGYLPTFPRIHGLWSQNSTPLVLAVGSSLRTAADNQGPPLHSLLREPHETLSHSRNPTSRFSSHIQDMYSLRGLGNIRDG